MSQDHQLLWQMYPKTKTAKGLLRDAINVFQKDFENISSFNNASQTSDSVLSKLTPDLENLGFAVETGKNKESQINVPVLYGRNGVPLKNFDADAYSATEQIVIEVEAGQATINYKFLKDIFEACVMDDVKYLIIAVRQEYYYRSQGRQVCSRDFDKICDFLDTLYASNGIQMKLDGIVIVGY
jgi:hypothetical protein